MARIFISYKRVDKDKVFKIKDQIESALNEKCWIDIDGIESDAQFENVIIRAINECEIVLFMYSNTHTKIKDFDKDWTIRELNFAEKKNKRTVFVNIDGSKLTDKFEFRYGTKQQVDGCSQEAIKKLISDLRNWLTIDYIQPEVPNNKITTISSITSSKSLFFYAISLILSVVFCISWLYVSGAQESNPSLGYFAVFASSICITYLSYFLLNKSHLISKFHILTSLSIIFAFTFFSAYTCMAVSLSFIDVSHMTSNLPSVPFSIMATAAVGLLMCTKKWGYGLLWLSGLGLSIGSYWWIMHYIWVPVIMVILSIVLMLGFTFILMLKKNGVSVWSDMFA